jgi:dipeptidyl aminopeptidase/acylaminoacyl peptidase
MEARAQICRSASTFSVLPTRQAASVRFRQSGRVAGPRLAVLVVCLGAMAAGGCGSGDSTATSASAECDESGPVLALNRNNPDVHGLAEVIVARRDGGVELVTGDWIATKPSFSPDGRSLVVVRADGDYESAGPNSTSLWIVDIDGTNPRALTEGQLGDYDDDPAWSPDGATIAFSRQTPGAAGYEGQVVTVPAEGGEVVPVLPNEGHDDTAPAWSWDGQQLAFIRGDLSASGPEATTVWVVGADGTHPRAVTAVPDAHSVGWHPDGEMLLVSTFSLEDGTVWLVDIRTGTATQVAEHATFAAWSPDGKTIYYFTKDGARESSWWRLAQGRLAGDLLERQADVGQIEDYLYPYFGLAVSPCA